MFANMLATCRKLLETKTAEEYAKDVENQVPVTAVITISYIFINSAFIFEIENNKIFSEILPTRVALCTGTNYR